MECTLEGDLHWSGTVYYNPNRIANILYMAVVEARGRRITYDSWEGGTFHVHNPDSGKITSFHLLPSGLYVHNFKAPSLAMAFVKTVDENRKVFTIPRIGQPKVTFSWFLTSNTCTQFWRKKAYYDLGTLQPSANQHQHHGRVLCTKLYDGGGGSPRPISSGHRSGKIHWKTTQTQSGQINARTRKRRNSEPRKITITQHKPEKKKAYSGHGIRRNKILLCMDFPNSLTTHGAYKQWKAICYHIWELKNTTTINTHDKQSFPPYNKSLLTKKGLHYYTKIEATQKRHQNTAT